MLMSPWRRRQRRMCSWWIQKMVQSIKMLGLKCDDGQTVDVLIDPVFWHSTERLFPFSPSTMTTICTFRVLSDPPVAGSGVVSLSLITTNHGRAPPRQSGGRTPPGSGPPIPRRRQGPPGLPRHVRPPPRSPQQVPEDDVVESQPLRPRAAHVRGVPVQLVPPAL